VHMGTRADQPVNDPDCREIEDTFAAEVACESERLLYVAMTRAQHYLIVTGHQVGRTHGFDTTTFRQRLWDACQAAGGKAEERFGLPLCALHRTVDDVPMATTAKEASEQPTTQRE